MLCGHHCMIHFKEPLGFCFTVFYLSCKANFLCHSLCIMFVPGAYAIQPEVKLENSLLWVGNTPLTSWGSFAGDFGTRRAKDTKAMTALFVSGAPGVASELRFPSCTLCFPLNTGAFFEVLVGCAVTVLAFRLSERWVDIHQRPVKIVAKQNSGVLAGRLVAIRLFRLFHSPVC